MAKNVDGLQQRFMDNPFSIINTSTDRWQRRKRGWVALGIESEVGRDARAFNIKEWMDETGDVQVATQSDTSIFDPALCEILYTWFVPDETRGDGPLRRPVVLDPFAGGSVRGIVAAQMGLDYVGIELRQEQVDANRIQFGRIGGKDGASCEWIQGDSNKRLDQLGDKYDFLLTCPPYGDLEVYSDHPDDISNMPTYEFDRIYASIMSKALSKMGKNTFVAVVVGDYRDKSGYLCNFVSKTIEACQVNGFRLFNEIILQNVVGTLALRVARQWETNRKIGKMHQNVLVFYNGDPKQMKEHWHKMNQVDQKTLADWL
jgi:DNA modification methylase